MFVPVVIIQTDVLSNERSEEDLVAAGFVEGSQFVMEHDAAVAKRLIRPGTKQLLITGTLYGDGEAAAKFVTAAKKINPELIVAFYSVYPTTAGPWDLIIKKGSGKNFTTELVESVRTFLEDTAS